MGVVLLALAGVIRPALWVAVLLLALPFYFGVKLPLLPGRFFSLIDLGIFGGLGIVAIHWLLARVTGWAPPGADRRRSSGLSLQSATYLLLAALISWALITVFDARYPALALREWRVVFLNAGLFAVLLAAVLRLSPRAESDRQLLVFAWLLGAAVVSLFGLWGYIAGGPFVSQAEGVRRVQAFYGSPNNLALYLDRTLAVSLALALFVHARRERWLWTALTAPQALAYFLTFSKGSLFLALPAMLLVLAVGGFWLLRREGRSTRPLWGMALLAVIGVLVLAPFVGAERFQQLFNLSGGTGFIRLQLWRSAWQMALDHPWSGVGPDNFLYAYRSDYLLPAAWQEPNLNHPHNLFLDWWTRLGLPGLVLGLGWITAGIAVIVRQLRTGPRPALALGLLAATAAALTHGLIDVSYALPDLMIVWVLMFGIDPAR